MNKETLFRIQRSTIAFAFACSCAACASNGSIQPSAQQTLVRACDQAQTAVTLATFFEEKMTPAEVKAVTVAQDSVSKFCSPSALAADLTPAAEATNTQLLGQIVADMNQLSDKGKPTP
jgi:hypothetical protein